MAYPNTKLDLRARMYLNGDWRDVEPDIKTAGKSVVAITRGQGVESSQVTATKCAFELRNTDGDYAPRNVLGQWYGHLKQNTPLEIAVGVITDPFDGTTVNGWGSTPDGLAWSTRGAGGTVAAANWQRGAGVASHAVPVASAYRESYLATVAYELVDVTTTFRLPGITTVTGGAVEPANLLLRGLSPGDYLMTRVTITTAQAFTIALYRQDGTLLAGPVTVDGLTYTAGGVYGVRMQADQWVLRAKVWDTAEGEPYDWPVDVASNWILSPGYVGVRSGVASGNSNSKPITFEYLGFDVTLPRCEVGLGRLPQVWNRSDTVAWARVEGAGLLQRLGQGKEPVRDVLRQWIPGNGAGLVGYWPLGEGPLGTVGLPVVGTAPMVLTPRQATSVYWGRGDVGPVLDRGIAMHGGDSIGAQVAMPATTEWSFDWVRASAHATDSTLTITTTAGTWVVTWFANTDIRVARPDGSTLSYGVIPGEQLGSDDGGHYVRFRVEQTGGNVFWALSIDGLGVLSQTWSTATMGPITGFVYAYATATDQPDAIKDVAVYTTRPDLAEAVDVFRGRPGEPAGERIARLGEERGIPLWVCGDPADTEPMGPQRPAGILALIRDCVDADGGILYEPHIGGLGYRTRVNLYNQTAAATIDYPTRGHVRDLVPVPSDVGRRNDWTITRRDGGSARHEQTTGPMSTAEPPEGIGRLDDAATLDLATDDQCAPIAEQRVWLGIWDEDRVEQLGVSLLAGPALIPTVSALTAGDRVLVTSPPIWCGPDTLDVQVLQQREQLGLFPWSIEMATRPDGPWRAFVLDTDYLDTDGTELASGLAATAVGAADSLSVAITDGPLWATATADRVDEIVVAGERMTVTGVSGGSSPQTITVLRGANGITKAHDAGTPVQVSYPAPLLR